MLRESGVRLALKEVGLIDVCRRAGFKSAGSGYKIWATQDDFHADLLRHAAEPSSEAGVIAVSDLIDALGGGSGGFAELVRLVATAQITDISDRPDYEVYLALWLERRADPEIARLVEEADQALLGGFADVYAAAAATYDREFVPPFNPEMLAVAISALSEGMTIRLGITPDLVPPPFLWAPDAADPPAEWHLFATSVWALVDMMTRPRTRTGDEAPAEAPAGTGDQNIGPGGGDASGSTAQVNRPE